MCTWRRSPWAPTPTQLLKAMTEAEAYHGPSLIIAYAPCINHGIKMNPGAGSRSSKAVEAGYWPLYRYNPELPREQALHSGLQGSHRRPTRTSSSGENRYASLLKSVPRSRLRSSSPGTEEDAKERLESYKKMAAE